MPVRNFFTWTISLIPFVLAGQPERFIYQDVSGIVANEIIKGITKDSTGYIWLATDQGVLNYDGTETTLHYRGLQSPFTKNFLNTAEHRLLVINDFGLKEVIKQGDTVFFAPFERDGQVYDQQLNYPKSIYQDRSGTIWIGEVNSIVRINSSGFRRFDLGAEFQSISYHRTFSFAEDAFGNLWIAPFKGPLLRYDASGDELERVEVHLPVTDVTGLTVVKGDYLLAGGKEGVFQLKIDSDHRILETTFLKSLTNISAMLTVGNTVYAGTWDRGLFLYDFGVGTIRRSDLVGFTDIVDFYFDRRSSEIWVVGSENVGLFKRSVISSIADIGQYRVESLSVSGQELFYSIGQEIRSLDLRSPDLVSRVVESKNKYFDCIEVVEDDLWIGDSFGAIYRYDLQSDRLMKVKDSVGRAVKFAFEDRDGNKWFTGDEKGLIKIDRQDRIIYYANVTTSNIIRQAPDGTIFCGGYGSDQLLFQYAPEADSFQRVSLSVSPAPKYNVSVEDLAFGSGGELWLASNHGLFRLVPGDAMLRQVRIPDTDPDEYYKALAHHQGILWAACTRGLIAFDGAAAVLFTNDNGLPSKILKERGLKIYRNQLLVATAKGLAQVDTDRLQFKKTARPIFKKILLNGSSAPGGDQDQVVLPYRGRLQAEFVTLSYPGKDIVYQSRLIGLDDTWSAPGANRQVSFLGFYEGDYVLEVRSREKGYLWSEPATFRFSVEVPWFKTVWAYLLFSVATIAAFGLGVRIYHYSLIMQKRRLQKIIEERTRQINAQKNEIIEQKNRIITQKEELIAKNNAVFKSQQALSEADLNYLHLKEKQLQDQIEYRNKQITTHTLNIIQKNETLRELRNKLEKIIKSPDRIPQNELRKTLKIIDESFKLDKDWEEFKLYFEQIYTGFYTKLKINCPSITNQELRHCALIRLNLSLVECASILGISPDSVKVSRARIRKKLDLDHGQSLTDFILSV